MVNRIRELLDIRQLSPTQFADLIGVGRPVISHILSERNKPSLEVVQKVISAFPDVSLSWLMSGTGPMLTGPAPAANAPTIPPIATQSAISTADTVPVAQVQSPVSIETPAIPIAPPLAAPTPIAPLAAIAPVPAPLPIAAAAIPPVAQPARLPQPPKFRPAAKAVSYPESSIQATAPAPVLPTSPIEAPLAATLPVTPHPTPVSEPVVLPSASIPLTPPVISAPVPPTVVEVPPAPVYSTSAESAVAAPAPISAPASVPVSPAEALSPAAPNPAAAFSFLGEAGKTIRRIVLFYSDGSFSDYKPEGQ